MRRETLTRRQMLTLMSSPLLVVGSGAFTEAHAEAYWSGFGDFRIGDVHFSVGVHSAHTGRSRRHPGYYYRTTHRLNHKKHRCGAYCYRRSQYNYHHESCPLLGVHFERYGAPPAHYAARSWGRHDGYRYDGHGDRPRDQHRGHGRGHHKHRGQGRGPWRGEWHGQWRGRW